MKLIYCKVCRDILAIRLRPRVCQCRQSGCQYVDSINAEIWGEAVPLGFLNDSFIEALKGRPERGLGKRFTAFVIPEECDTVTIR